MQIQQLKYLMKVVECGSITRAAQQLFLSQPSLTKSISNLESEYRIKIFDRKPKGIQLTAQGKEFLVYAQAILKAIDSLDQVFTGYRQPRRHLLSISAQQLSFLYDLLLQTYRQFEDTEIYIDLMEADRGKVVESVLSRTADIGLVVYSDLDAQPFRWLMNDKNLEYHVIDSSNILISIGPNSPFYEQDELNVSDLFHCLQIVMDVEKDAKNGFYPEKINFINSKRVFFCNSIASCIHFLLKTDAFVYTPKWVVDYFKDTPIRSIPIQNLTQGNYLAWIKRSNEATSVVERQFVCNLCHKLGCSVPPF